MSEIFVFFTWKVWLIVGLVALAVEILPPPTHFYLLCVSLGALAASIFAFFFGPSWAAWIAFVAVSFALIPILVPLARFLFTSKADPSTTDETESRAQNARRR